MSSTDIVFNGTLAFASVNAGGLHACSVTAGGDAYCWGFGGSGRLGNGATSSSSVPVPVSGGLAFSSVSAGGSHTCGLTTVGGGVHCWGGNSDGQLGNASFTDRVVPAPIVAPAGVTFASVSAGRDHTCAVSTTGAAYCWGENFDGQLGDLTATNRNTPVLVTGLHTFGSVSAGGNHTCGVTTTNVARCWGKGVSGQIGDNSFSITDRTSPVLVLGGHLFNSVSAGNGHTCGVTTTGVAYCWGGVGAAGWVTARSRTVLCHRWCWASTSGAR